MDKFSLLLDESTIVNFKLLWKLASRYRSHFVIAAALFFTIFILNYYAQPIIYAVNVPMKAVANHTVSKDLTGLLPVDNANNVSLTELKVSTGNFTFMKTYADLVIQDEQFERLNFGAISSSKNIYGRGLIRICGKNKECLTEKLAGLLSATFSIEQGLTEDRFVLSVNAIDKNTVNRITTILLKALEINRVHVRQYLVLKEIQSVGNLISESRSIMEKMDGYKALEDQEKLQNNIQEIKERMKMLQYNASIENANVTALESRLSENKKSTSELSVGHNSELEGMQKLQIRLGEIQQNIIILSNIAEDRRSASDNLIISQLKEEQEKILKILPNEHHRKKMELNASFVEGQRGKAGDYQFDYLVAKSKLDKLNLDFEKSKNELNEMLQLKMSSENKVVGMKTDMDFLKNLESKQMSLKLLNATMTSDLFFEDVSTTAREFRQSTYMKISLFSFSISAFLYLISILLRYLFDDRIYGEEEIRGYLKNLDFVGEVPIFN